MKMPKGTGTRQAGKQGTGQEEGDHLDPRLEAVGAAERGGIRMISRLPRPSAHSFLRMPHCELSFRRA